MTREKAIRCLEICKKYIDKIRASEGVEVSKEVCMALDMAIKALEQEPCDDCVSRQEVEELLRCGCAYDIWNLPSVIPKREQGEWIINEEDESIKCPSCGGEFYTWGISTERIKKCPNCGAKMIDSDEEGEEGEI